MQRRLSCFFVVLYLLVALTPFQIREELDKLPQLVRHLQLHRQINPDLSFLAFWSMHYGKGFARHAGSHDHSRLPGKGSHQHLSSCSCAMDALPVAAVPVLAHTQLPASKDADYPETGLLPSSHLYRIWQPPKFC